MKTKFAMLLAISVVTGGRVLAQNVFPASGSVGVGTGTPTSLLDVRNGTIQMVPGTAGYSFIARSAPPNNNESYLYHIISPSYHIIGSSKNGSGGLLRKLGFAVGTTDSESDVKMTIDNLGNIGMGTPLPGSQLHLASDATHAFTISRKDGTYGFRILRDAAQGNFQFQIGTGTSTWETKIKIGEGEGTGTKLIFNPDGGNVLIGKITQLNAAYKLDVNGSLRANEVVVNTTGADFVFEENYKLPSLLEVESFIKQHKHLPDVAPAAEMEKNGLSVGEMDIKLLQKMEEMTLYMIELRKEMDRMKLENESLKREVVELKSR